MSWCGAYTVRVESLRDLIELHDREIAMLEREIGRALADDVGYHAALLGRGAARRSSDVPGAPDRLHRGGVLEG